MGSASEAHSPARDRQRLTRLFKQVRPLHPSHLPWQPHGHAVRLAARFVDPHNQPAAVLCTLDGGEEEVRRASDETPARVFTGGGT